MVMWAGALRQGDLPACCLIERTFPSLPLQIQENVKPALALLLDRIKAEAIEKCESFSVE